MLQFRRARGRECTSCCALIRAKPRDLYNDPNLENRLRTDPEAKETFLEDLEEFEAQKRQDAVAKSSRPSVKRVEASHKSGFKMRMVMGYFWPTEVMKREGKTVPKQLTTIKYNGKSYKGAILDPSHGTPIGVIEMESYDDKGAAKVTCICI